jgi:hypothetical protein
MEPTIEQLHTLRHMLGINDPSKRVPKPYRNYAAVNPGDAEFLAMEAAGLVELYTAADPSTSYHWYRCTEAGRLAAMRSFRDIRYSAAKRRYSAFLNVSDAVPDLTFKQFLTLPDFAEARRA